MSHLYSGRELLVSFMAALFLVEFIRWQLRAWQYHRLMKATERLRKEYINSGPICDRIACSEFSGHSFADSDGQHHLCTEHFKQRFPDLIKQHPELLKPKG